MQELHANFPRPAAEWETTSEPELRVAFGHNHPKPDACGNGGPQCERLILEPRPEYQRMLRRLGGLTPNGKPALRLVWGWSALTWGGGVYQKATGLIDPVTNDEITTTEIQRTNLFLKYGPPIDALNSWHIESWNPPELYGSPEGWKQLTTELAPDLTLIETLGPYPSEGEYEPIFTFGAVQGEPLPYFLFETGIYFIQEAKSMLHTRRQLQKQKVLEEETLRKKKAFEEAIDAEWEEAMDPFGGLSHVVVPGAYNPAMQKGASRGLHATAGR